MKRRVKFLAGALTLAMFAFGLAACGNSSSGTSMVSGKTYAFESYTVDGTDATDTITAMYKEQTITFAEDGTCTQSTTWSDAFAEQIGSSDPVEQSGTYTEKGSNVTVTLTAEDEEFVMEFEADGDSLTMTEDGCVTVYKAK